MSNGKKWTIHGIIQNMGFNLTKANPNVMMRENLKTKFCEYEAVYVNDLASEDIFTTLKTKCKLKIKRNIKLCYDPGRIMACQLKKYFEELHGKFIKHFKDNPCKDLETFLDKVDLSSVYQMMQQHLVRG